MRIHSTSLLLLTVIISSIESSFESSPTNDSTAGISRSGYSNSPGRSTSSSRSLIQIISKNNPALTFELYKYNFPANTPIRLETPYTLPDRWLSHEQVVLSTSNGDVYAIVEGTKILLGLFMYDGERLRRAKINMNTGITSFLTRAEINGSPVGPKGPITKFYRMKPINHVNAAMLNLANLDLKKRSN